MEVKIPFLPTVLNRILSIAETRIYAIELERLKSKRHLLKAN